MNERNEKTYLLSESADRISEGNSIEIRVTTRTITVEPIIILYFTGFMKTTPLTQQYIYGQIGQKYNASQGGVPGEELCGLNMSKHDLDLHNKIQRETSK